MSYKLNQIVFIIGNTKTEAAKFRDNNGYSKDTTMCFGVRQLVSGIDGLPMGSVLDITSENTCREKEAVESFRKMHGLQNSCG